MENVQRSALAKHPQPPALVDSELLLSEGLCSRAKIALNHFKHVFKLDQGRPKRKTQIRPQNETASAKPPKLSQLKFHSNSVEDPVVSTDQVAVSDSFFQSVALQDTCLVWSSGMLM